MAEVRFYNDEARTLWNGLKHDAEEASKSDDAEKAKSGALLFGAMNAMEASSEVVTVGVENKSNGSGRMNSGGYAIRVNPNGQSQRTGRPIPSSVVLAHEIGHVYGFMIQHKFDYFDNWGKSVTFENAGRRVEGCGGTRRAGLDIVFIPGC
jgi:hypothetical protein